MDKVDMLNKLIELKKTDGWGIIEKHIKHRINDNIKQLRTCDISKINEYRSKAEVLEQVLFYIDDQIKQGQEQLNER